jgi:hypothetical protein
MPKCMHAFRIFTWHRSYYYNAASMHAGACVPNKYYSPYCYCKLVACFVACTMHACLHCCSFPCDTHCCIAFARLLPTSLYYSTARVSTARLSFLLIRHRICVTACKLQPPYSRFGTVPAASLIG